MTSTISTCLQIVAPFYNLALVVILVILFIKLFSLKSKKVFIKPWKFIFIALLVYVVEESINIFESMQVIPVNVLVYPILELIIITLFIYMLLLQKQYTKK